MLGNAISALARTQQCLVTGCQPLPRVQWRGCHCRAAPPATPGLPAACAQGCDIVVNGCLAHQKAHQNQSRPDRSVHYGQPSSIHSHVSPGFPLLPPVPCSIVSCNVTCTHQGHYLSATPGAGLPWYTQGGMLLLNCLAAELLYHSVTLQVRTRFQTGLLVGGLAYCQRVPFSHTVP